MGGARRRHPSRRTWNGASPPSRRDPTRCCVSRLEIVDGIGGKREVYDTLAFGTDRPRQSDRLAARLRARRCTEVFGLIRRDALRGTALIADHVGADRTLLIELALRGRFVGVPELLFVNRDHPGRFTRRNLTLRAQAEWYAPAGPARRVLRTWTLYAICLRLVRAHVTEPAERLRCYWPNHPVARPIVGAGSAWPWSRSKRSRRGRLLIEPWLFGTRRAWP